MAEKRSIFVRPGADGKTYLGWLQEVVAIVDAVLAERRRNGEEW